MPCFARLDAMLIAGRTEKKSSMHKNQNSQQQQQLELEMQLHGMEIVNVEYYSLGLVSVTRWNISVQICRPAG